MGGNGFPSMSASDFKRLLCKVLGYKEEADSGPGSHCWLRSDRHPDIRWAFHRREVSSIEIRNVLVKQVGLSVSEAREVVK